MIFLPQTRACDSEIDLISIDLVHILCYPRNISPHAYICRINELDNLGIVSFLSAGSTKIGKFNVLGKGGVGIVIKVKAKDNKIYALKIRRADANRLSMEREFVFHRMANLVGVGPGVYAYSENFILMDYVDGWDIDSWLSQPNISANQIRNLVTNALEQCYSLDMANLDHGELSFLNHHLLVSKDLRAQIIDFESSSLSRPPRNVTSASNGLLLSGQISKLISNNINFKQREELLRLLRTYKHDKNRMNFEKILKVLD